MLAIAFETVLSLPKKKKQIYRGNLPARKKRAGTVKRKTCPSRPVLKKMMIRIRSMFQNPKMNVNPARCLMPDPDTERSRRSQGRTVKRMKNLNLSLLMSPKRKTCRSRRSGPMTVRSRNTDPGMKKNFRKMGPKRNPAVWNSCSRVLKQKEKHR